MIHAHRPALIQWLREISKPVGIMAFDDSASHDLAEACLEADIGVPEQVAIIGLNNDELLCECHWPPLSEHRSGLYPHGLCRRENPRPDVGGGELSCPTSGWFASHPLASSEAASTMFWPSIIPI